MTANGSQERHGGIRSLKTAGLAEELGFYLEGNGEP